MVRIDRSDRTELLRLLEEAVRAQVRVYELLSRVEEIAGQVIGLDAWVLREAGDWDKSEDARLTDKSLTCMLREVSPER